MPPDNPDACCPVSFLLNASIEYVNRHEKYYTLQKMYLVVIR